MNFLLSSYDKLLLHTKVSTSPLKLATHMCGFSFVAVTILLIAKSVLSLYLVVLLHSDRNMVLSSFFWFRVAKSFFIFFPPRRFPHETTSAIVKINNTTNN